MLGVGFGDPMWKSFKLWSEIVDPDEFFLVIVHVLVDVALWQLLSKMVNFDCLNCCLCCSAFSLWCFFFFFGSGVSVNTIVFCLCASQLSYVAAVVVLFRLADANILFTRGDILLFRG